MAAKKITRKDPIVWRLLKDPRYRVTKDGKLLTRVRPSGDRASLGPWRRAGWVSPSRGGTKVYRRVQYMGEELYEHRIIHAAVYGKLCPYRTVNHDDLNGLNNQPGNIADQATTSENIRHARAFYRRTGMSAAEARANYIRGAGGGRQWRGTSGAHQYRR
jgi:hypothetical protein